jgi:hypothetical protein
MRKRYVAALAVAALAVAASVIFAPSALSDPPTIQRFPIDATFFDDVDCGFPVQIDIVGTDVEITSGNRVFDAFLQSTATVTNLDTGTSITVSIVGPSHITLNDDGSFTLVGTGPSLFFFTPPPLLPGITLLNGRLVLTVDSQGNPTSFSSVGETRDLCAELAG